MFRKSFGLEALAGCTHKRITLASIILTGLIPAIGFMLNGAWPLAALSAGVGGLWLIDWLRGWDKLASWLLAGFVVLAALGVGMSGGGLWAPPLVVMALVAWDLQRFMGRASSLSPSDDGHKLEQQHLGRLSAVSGLGLASGWIAASAHLKLSLGTALALGFLALLGISQIIRTLVQESD